jgi:allophanate hydrolase
MTLNVLGWSIAEHLAARRNGLTASAAIDAVLRALEELDDPAILIGAPLRDLAMAAATRIDPMAVSDLPLHGVPFLVKDNIDVAGAPTTCAFPPFARVAAEDAAVVARLRAAGAIPVGKTNLDQFATGLVGTRSPHGTPRNPLDASLVPGGSSSGSAVAVARGIVPFALGTDTAGSGRVPAAMCGIVGLKPTIGRFPSVGMVPAVRRIDCPSVFARNVADARMVAGVAAGWLPTDPYSKRPGEAPLTITNLGILSPDAPVRALMEPDALRAYDNVCELAREDGFTLVAVDLEPLLAAGRLLYGGAFVAERTAAVGQYFDPANDVADAEADPTVRTIVAGGHKLSAVDAYNGEYALAELRAVAQPVWDSVHALLLPTTPGVATLNDLAAEPIAANARLGTFTTFTNLLDLAAIAIPVGLRPDGLPFGVQLIGPAWSDEALADAASLLTGEPPHDPAVRVGETALVVVGAHLRGMALNRQLTDRQSRFVEATTTAPIYRLHALEGTVPPKPGLQRVPTGGAAIDVEVWALNPSAFASFVQEIPPPLAIGSLQLADGSWEKGFVCEPEGLAGATDITHFGGWRAYIQSKQDQP